jgi:hypothetical protein
MKKSKTIIIKGKIYSKDIIKKGILTNDVWLYHAINRIYSFQTSEEQFGEETVERNGKGFNSCHAGIMSSMAKGLKKYGRLTPGQKETAREIMVKYAGQIFEYLKDKYEQNR